MLRAGGADGAARVRGLPARKRVETIDSLGKAFARRGIGNEHLRATIDEDVADLLRLQHRIDRHENRVGPARRENRRAFLQAFRQEDRNPVAARHTRGVNCRGQSFHLGLELTE